MTEHLCALLFLILMIAPGLYGLHLAALAVMSHTRRHRARRLQQLTIERYQRNTPDEQWPIVTTQVPLYNERDVARRAISAACAMEYPRGRHEVQVLDDSTDETRAIVDQTAAELRQAGHDVKVVRRANRRDFKAGALADALPQARGEYFAIFDADFVPDPGFLRRMIPLIATEPKACAAQGRWGHLNAEESWIASGLALAIDGHHAIEQAGRSWNGLCITFNGTGGIWRRAAIEDPQVGGWSGDTITEDLDLSYRAQMQGWRIIYSVDEVAPAELPANVNALKAQQRRWALGSTQTARKLLPLVWRSRLTPIQKIEATLHLTQYSLSIFMLLMLGLGRLLLEAMSPETRDLWLAWFWPILPFVILAPPLSYIYARWAIGGGWSGVRHIPKLMVMGLGLSVNNTLAVAQGLVQRGGEFIRTPKSGSVDGAARKLSYGAVRSRLWIIEIALGVACFVQWAVFLDVDRYVGGTFLVLYGIGLCLLGWASRPTANQAPRPRVSTSITPPARAVA